MKKASLRVVCGFCVGILCVAGCGQTGPLYLPGAAPSAAGLSKQTDKVKKQNVSSASASSVSASAISVSANATSDALTVQSTTASSVSASTAR